MTRSRQTADWGSRAGLAKVIPSSVAVGSGTGSADTTGTVTFSGVSSLSLNGVFSATYQNYRIMFSAYGSSAQIPTLKLRASGTDSSASYYSGGGLVNFSATWAGVGGGNISSWDYGRPFGHLDTATDGVGTSSLDLFSPFEAKKTTYTSLTLDPRTGGNGAGHSGGFHNVASSYDGFTITMPSGNMTGTIRVYGYN